MNPLLQLRAAIVATFAAFASTFKGMFANVADLTPETLREWFRGGLKIVAQFAAATATKIDDAVAAAALAVVNDDSAWQLIQAIFARQVVLVGGCPCPGPCPKHYADFADCDLEAALQTRITEVAPGINPANILAIIQMIMEIIQKFWPSK